MSSPERHWFGPHKDNSPGGGHPVMFGAPQPTHHFGPMRDGGGYPKGFVEWALGEMRCDDAGAVLHLCSGSMLTGLRLDVRESMNPDVVADCRAAPFRNESFGFILADPPYAEDYAANLYGTARSYPTPGAIVHEAARLLVPGGLFGLLHFLVPMVRKPMMIEQVYGVTTGSGYAIRAWTLMRKRLTQEVLAF